MAASDQVARVTIFEVLALGAVVGCGIAAMALVRPATLFTTFGVFVLGCAVPVIAYLAINALMSKREPLPICRNNRCHATKYQIERRVEEGDYYRCSCGDLYLLTPDEQFKVVGPDGVAEPYRRRYYRGGPWLLSAELLDLEKYREKKE